MPSSLGKGEVDSEGIAMPISMDVAIGEVNPVSNDSKANSSRKGVEVKRGKTSNPNFRNSNTIFDIPTCEWNPISLRE